MKKIFYVICSLAVVGCATTQTMNSHSNLPQAKGEVWVKPEQNGNSAVHVTVKNLQEPVTMEPNASTYVVWAQSSESSLAQNLGALKVDNKNEADLRTVTPFQKFDLFITAEPLATVQYPTGDRALWTSVKD